MHRGIAKAWVGAYFGPGSGRVLLDEVSCTGNEFSIEQCPKPVWGEHNCDHTEDAGVSCTPLTGRYTFVFITPRSGIFILNNQNQSPVKLQLSCPINAHNRKMCICMCMPQPTDSQRSQRQSQMIIPGVNVTSHSQMVRCVWWGVPRVSRADWKFITEVSGGRCVMMAGHRPTRRSSAGSWASGSAMFFIVCVNYRPLC